MECSSEPDGLAAGAGALPRARRRCEAGKRTHGPGTRACLALLAATALLALAAPAQAQTEIWSATLTPGDLSSGILGCSNGVSHARCSNTSFLSEDSFTYDSTDYNIAGLFVRSTGRLEFSVDADITTATAALTLVVGSTSFVLADATTINTRSRYWSSSGVSLTAGTDITVKLTAPGTPNTAPTAEDKTVTTGEDRAYAFTADDFGFADDDDGATLASVTIVTVPSAGTLALDGTAVMADDVVTTAQIDADMLTFTPARDAHGAPYTTFTFTVNDGTDDSAIAYTMTIDVTDAPAPVCGVPGIAGAGRRQIWSSTVTVGAVTVLGVTQGYGFDETASVGELALKEFDIGSNNYTIYAIGVSAFGGGLFLSLDGNAASLTATETAALRLHVCDGDYDFSTATRPPGNMVTFHWTTSSLDWSPPVVTRTVYLSLPANNAATGEPTISGTAQAGQELTADASPIMDTDGLASVSYSYQWVRVDADGTSNEEAISGEIAATYTLTNDDVGKRIKVQVSFTDELSGLEMRTSAAGGWACTSNPPRCRTRHRKRGVAPVTPASSGAAPPIRWPGCNRKAASDIRNRWRAHRDDGSVHMHLDVDVRARYATDPRRSAVKFRPPNRSRSPLRKTTSNRGSELASREASGSAGQGLGPAFGSSPSWAEQAAQRP